MGYSSGIYPRQRSQSRALSLYGSMPIALNTGLYACGWLTIHRTCYIDISNALLFILAASGLSSHWHTILHTIYISILFAEPETFSGGFACRGGGGGGPTLFYVNLINFNFPGGWDRMPLPLPRYAHLY